MSQDVLDSNIVHHILSRSYSVYFFSVMAGMIMGTIFADRFAFMFYREIGLFVMVVGTLFIYWAQSTSGKSKKQALATNTPRNFARGPYKITRNPTHIGLAMLTIGFGFVSGSFFILFFSILAFLTSKIVFLPAEEKVLEQKYGQEYLDYKKKVRSWL